MKRITEHTTQAIVSELIFHTKAKWVELCLTLGIDFEKYKLDFRNFGTRFEVQIPEFTFNEEEE
tara:strand:- start:119 stop:310 length:192 start_codon:yes stop_codon:yes gene_type:complete